LIYPGKGGRVVASTLILGAVVGFLVAFAVRADAIGVSASVIFGMIGAILGHGSADILGLVREGSLAGWRLAFAGALCIPLLLRSIGLFSRTSPAPERIRPR
jgi:uncharacterized membrane protein YeaQ/YmgE (transglycosylase-associated protein family)